MNIGRAFSVAATWAGPMMLLVGFSTPVQAWTGSHYSLELRPDFEKQSLVGRARIELRADDSPGGFVDIRSPRLDMRNVEINGLETTGEKSKSGWRIPIPQELKKELSKKPILELDLTYRVGSSSGLVFGDGYVYTAFHTCRWMPCAGSDLSRASVTFDLQLPAGTKSVASGERLDGPVNSHKWHQSAPYPLYTFGFAAGRFTETVQSVGDRELRFLGVDQTEGDLRAKFRDSALMLEFFKNKAGLPLPPKTYTQVLVPGGVAQEVSTFSMIGARWLDPILDNPQEDWIIAHEMAHQWWGNLITCATWNELWLNEGLTVFMTMAWKQHRWGEAAYERELRLSREAWKRAQDAGFDKPLRWSGDYPNLRIRRSIQYSKAALFFVALREQLGEEKFWTGLRTYTRQFAGQTVRGEDFQKAIEDSSGQNLQVLFNRWVY